MIIVAFIDYKIMVKISPILYGISIILLIAVLFTKSINGASSWFNIGFFSFQPAELAKVSVILFLASVMVKIQERGKTEINVFCSPSAHPLVVYYLFCLGLSDRRP